MATAASTTPTATIHTYLYHFTKLTGDKPAVADFPANAEKVIDIKSYPDLGGDPEKIDVTTLSDSVQRNINGVQQMDTMQFTANYTKGDKRKLDTLEKKGESEWYAVVFGADADGTPDGHDGIVFWQGGVSSYVSGGDVNAARELTIVISTATAPELMADA